MCILRNPQSARQNPETLRSAARPFQIDAVASREGPEPVSRAYRTLSLKENIYISLFGSGTSRERFPRLRPLIRFCDPLPSAGSKPLAPLSFLIPGISLSVCAFSICSMASFMRGSISRFLIFRRSLAKLSRKMTLKPCSSYAG